MALINKIREKSGLVIGVVAVGLILFLVGGDILGPNSALLGQNKQIIGVVDGVDVELSEFTREVEAYKAEYQLIYKYKFNDSEMGYVRNKAWERIVERIAYKKEYEKLGIIVTDEEVKDMVQGNNIIPEIGEGFKDPNTGQVDRTNIVRYLQNINRYPAEQQYAFFALEAGLRPKRLREKYNSLFSQTQFITEEEAKQRYEESNTKADLSYLTVGYATISDSLITVSDEQLKEYYNRKKVEFKQDQPSLALEFVSFPVVASAQDSAEIKREMEQIRANFEKTDNDSLFVKENSESFNNFQSYSMAELPASLSKVIKVEKGFISEPMIESGAYRLYKVLGMKQDSVYTMRASHILIRYDEKSNDAAKKEEAKKKAMEVLAKAKAGEDFAALATQYGEDGTKSSGGDLSWFKQGQMVPKFEKPIYDATKEGLLPNLVETEYGFHIVKVTGLKNNEKINLGVISKPISPSEASRNAAYQIAGDFATALDEKDFIAKTDARNKVDKNFIRSEALDVKLDAKYINSLSGNVVREIILWGFGEESELGKVSKVFEGDDVYVVTLLKKRFDEEYSPLDKVSDKVLLGVRNEIKAKQIIEKLSKSKGTLDEMATAYGKDARVMTGNVAFSAFSLTGLGYAPKALGAAFGLKEKGRSPLIQEEVGVVLIELTKLDKAAEVADYNKYKEEIVTDKKGIWANDLSKALERLTDSKNEINRFY